MSVYFDDLVPDIDRVVPDEASHIGLVLMDFAGNLRVQPTYNHTGRMIPRCKRESGKSTSDALLSLGAYVTKYLYPISGLCYTSHSTTFYFVALTKEGMVLDVSDGGVSIEEASREISFVTDPASRKRDLSVLKTALACEPSPIRRILGMVRELHLLGYERLRIGFDSAAYGTLAIVPRHWTLKQDGIHLSANAKRFPFSRHNKPYYDLYMLQRPFGWKDAAFLSARELAHRFLAAFPEVTMGGWGNDKQYVNWYRQMLTDLTPLGYFSTNSLSAQRLSVVCHERLSEYPCPPGGDADE